MAINTFEIMKGLVTALKANAAVKTALGTPARIYSAVRPNAVFPFARVDPVGGVPFEMVIGGTAAKSQLTTDSFRISVFTLKMSAEQASDAIEAIEAVMKTGAFTIAGSARMFQANFTGRGGNFDPIDNETSGWKAWTQWAIQMQDT